MLSLQAHTTLFDILVFIFLQVRLFKSFHWINPSQKLDRIHQEHENRQKLTVSGYLSTQYLSSNILTSRQLLCAGAVCQARERVFYLVISSDGKQHPATAPIYQAQMRCQGSTAMQRAASPFLHRQPICHRKWGKQYSPGVLDTHTYTHKQIHTDTETDSHTYIN